MMKRISGAIFATSLFAMQALAQTPEVPIGPSGGGAGGGGGSGTVTSVGVSAGFGTFLTVGTPTTTPTLAIAGATSGGIPCFDSTTSWKSSALLAANALTIGGGAGACPSTTTTDATALTALGVTPIGSGKIVLQTSPTLITPVLGVATGASLALGGASIGSNVLALVGTTGLTVNSNASVLNMGGGVISLNSNGVGSIVAPEMGANFFVVTGSVPTDNTGSCIPSAISSGSTGGFFTAPICTGGTIILSGMPTVTRGYNCAATDETTPADTVKQTGHSTTSVTFTATTVAGDSISFSCPGS